MKKTIALALSFIIALSLCACSGNTNNAVSSDSSQNFVSTSDAALSTVAVTENTAAVQEKSEKFKELEKYDVDIDMNGLNKTMTTAQMTSITNNPQEYLGKTIRLTATYQKQPAETGDKKNYNFAFGYDDTGCCAAWYIEFYGDCVPDDIEDFSSISMVGKIAQYSEGSNKYLYIDVEHFAV